MEGGDTRLGLDRRFLSWPQNAIESSRLPWWSEGLAAIFLQHQDGALLLHQTLHWPGGCVRGLRVLDHVHAVLSGHLR